MIYLSHLECSSCQKRFDPFRLRNLCPDCGKPLMVKYDLESLGKRFSRNELQYRIGNIWRYRELLPVEKDEYQLCLGEGWTPLIKADKLGRLFDFSYLYLKDEGLNPTGSFKARGLCVAVSKALELGALELSIPSAGNAAGAMSAYAALAGLPAHVYMPHDVPETFIAECKAYGARINLVEGLINDCGEQAIADAVKFNRFDLSTLKEPYRVEGKKTMGFELAEQMNWTLPDVIIYPTGGGTGLVGMWKAFNEMQELGWIDDSRPRMVCVQAEGCAPMVRSFHEQKKFAEPWQNASTVADGLRVPSAIGDFIILNILRQSKGTAIAISDAEMMEGANTMGKTQGLFVSPETGATCAAFGKLRQSGWIRDGEKVVLFNTGSGYKYSHLWKE